MAGRLHIPHFDVCERPSGTRSTSRISPSETQRFICLNPQPSLLLLLTKDKRCVSLGARSLSGPNHPEPPQPGSPRRTFCTCSWAVVWSCSSRMAPSAISLRLVSATQASSASAACSYWCGERRGEEQSGTEWGTAQPPPLSRVGRRPLPSRAWGETAKAQECSPGRGVPQLTCWDL